jgi:metallophosphoesterase superfamily enzyme
MRLEVGKETVLVLPDMQAPYHHKDALAFLCFVRDKYKPTRVVCIGDSVDFHRLAKFSPVADAPGPKQEHDEAKKFLHALYNEFPAAQEVASNHNVRYAKRASDAGLPSAFLKSYSEIMEHPKGWSIHDYVEIDGVMYEHGDRFGGSAGTRQSIASNGQSTVFGHHHSHAGIQYAANRKRLQWAMNVGCLVDHKSYGMAYARVARAYQTLGTGVVVRGVPHFEPMRLAKSGRWTRK